MHNVRRVQEHKPAEQLVHEVLVMLIGECLLRHYQSVKVGLHLFSNNVNVLILCFVSWAKNVNKSYNIFMIKELYKLVRNTRSD